MKPAELREMLEGTRPGDGSILRLVDVEREVVPLLVELWEACVEFDAALDDDRLGDIDRNRIRRARLAAFDRRKAALSALQALNEGAAK